MSKKFSITGDFLLEVGQAKKAIQSVQNDLNNLNMPDKMMAGIEKKIDAFQNKLREFEIQASKEITSTGDSKQLEKTADGLTKEWERLKLTIKDTARLSNDQLEQMFPKSAIDTLEAARKAVTNYNTQVKNNGKDVAETNGKITKSMTEVTLKTQELAKAQEEYNKLSRNAINDVQNLTGKTDIVEASKELDQLIEKARQWNEQVNSGKNASGRNYNYADITKQKAANNLQNLEDLKVNFDAEKSQIESYETKINDLKTKVDELNISIQQLQTRLTGLTTIMDQANSQALTDLLKTLQGTGVDTTGFAQTLEGATDAIQQFQEVNADTARNSINNVVTGMQQEGQVLDDIKDKTEDLNKSAEDMNQSFQEVDGIRTRITAFFGLQNAIELVKRAMRDAYDTVKELDKVMTETAVVTDFSVGDMWAQLPDYTKRANELGVSTKAAYEAATLYYQQGLKTNEVTALSNETLKMARIAGLEASEATDRMTNALRGFNMELNETSAQRVDDVYSQLAAKTASNVDEISTAMTKVASLANNANMEFETTAAFLAQIIETTRESAETAGTALKTVVARFSEVKDLYTKGDLTGKDEEGEVIDVNKIGQALRTAGVDLNKYFLGEVGLDDIFMELASKWDNLTKLQQRYIATQAAGSRQQSRFIALMSNYARTQELVGDAYNANGAAATQFGKTQESLESKLARLTNAWHEFTMGIANSTVIKAGVDLLTKILNIVNEITSGFGKLQGTAGGVITSILKLGTLGGGLFGGKKLIEKGSTWLGQHSTSIFGRIARAGLSETAKTAAEKAAGDHIASGGKGLIGTGIGKLVTAAGGALPLAGYIGIVAAAATTAYLVVKKLYDLSPAGQVKMAEKWAETLNQVNEKIQQQKKALTDIQKNYQNYTDNVNNAQTREEREEAIKSRNEYIKSLLEQDATYYKYIKELKDGTSGEIILTIDEEALANAIDIIAQGASRSQAASYFGQTMIAQKQAEYQESKITYSYSADTKSASERIREQAEGGAASINYTVDNTPQNMLRQQNAQRYKEEAQYYAELGIRELLTKQSGIDNLSSVTVANLGEAIAKGIDFSTITDKYQDQIDEYTNFFGTTLGAEARDELRAEYQSVYGVNPEEAGISIDEIRKQLAAYRVFSEKQEEASQKATELLVGDRGAQYAKALDAIFGEGLVGFDFSEGTHVFSLIQKYSGLTADELRQLYTTLGYSEKEFYRLSQGAKDSAIKIQQLNRAKIFESMLRNGNSVNEAQKQYIEQLTLEQQSQIADLLTNLQPFLSQEAMTSLSSVNGIGGFLSLAPEEFDQINSFFSTFDLSDPIDAFDKFIDAKNEAADGSTFEKLLKDTEEVNKAILNAGTVFKSFFESSEYDELTEDLDNFIKENKKISADNIDGLSKSSKALNALLKTGTITAGGLAKALTAVKTGNASIEGITERVLEAISTTDQFETLLEHTKTVIDGFDAGRDLTDISKFLIEQIDTLIEEFNSGRIGNEPTENIWNLLFGGTNDQNYRQWLASFNNDFDAAQAELQRRAEQLKGWLENESYGFMKEFAGSFGITDLGGGDFNWDLSGYENLEQLLDDIQEKTKATREVAETLFQGYAAHSIEIQEQLKEWSLNDTLQKLAESDTFSISTEELEALVAIYGDGSQTADDFLKKINEIRQSAGKAVLIKVNWADSEGNPLTGQALKNQWEEFLKSLKPPELGEDVKKYTSTDLVFDERFSGLANYADEYGNQLVAFLGDALNGKQIDIDKLYHLFSLEGIPESQWEESANFLISKLNHELDDNEEKYQFVKSLITVGPDGNTEIDQAVSDTAEGVVAAYETELAKQNFSKVAEVIATKIEESYNGVVIPTARTYKIENDLNNFFQNYHPTITPELNFGIRDTHSPEEREAFLAAWGMAAGGIVSTREFSLAGEEGPEIVWNKEGRYSYIAGANGPEFLTLYPGDRVFNAQDTARIFKNSKLNSKFGSHAGTPGFGAYRGDYVDGSEEIVEAIEEATEEVAELVEWRNDFDWLYNLMQDITELERKQTRLAEQHDRYLKDTSKTGRDLYNLTNAQLSNLYTQYNNQSAAYRLRQQEMQEQLAMSGASRYISWDSTGSKLNIDYNAIEALVDKDLYDKIKEMADTAEKIQSQIEEADDALWKIEGEIEELQNRYRDAYVDLEKRVMDALVQEYQNEIDELSEINDAVNDANSSILEALQEEISLSRQIRDNTDTENNIHEMEARLAYLRRDTTGANQNEILKLEKQLLSARRSYEDTLVDQSVERLGKQNDEAAEQREKNISLLTEQLEYWQEMGALWPEVADIINQGLSDDGALVTGSRLETILKDAEGWRGMSETQREVWAEELIKATNQAGAYLIQLENGLTQVGEDVTATIGSTSITSKKYWDEENKVGTKESSGGFMAQMLSAVENGDYVSVGALEKLRNQKIDNEGLGGTYPKTRIYDSYMAGRNSQIDSSVNYMTEVLEAIGAGNWDEAFKLAGMRDAKIASMTNSPYAQDETFKMVFNRWYDTTKGKRYAVGGLVTGTGPAWLDGTHSQPEYVLNAKQTEAFLKLADVLPSIFSGSSSFINGGNTYVDMTINVESIADDYDVDRLIDRVKEDMYSNSQYRNVVSLRQ